MIFNYIFEKLEVCASKCNKLEISNFICSKLFIFKKGKKKIANVYFVYNLTKNCMKWSQKRLNIKI